MTTAAVPIRVSLVEDDAAIRQSLIELIRASPGLRFQQDYVDAETAMTRVPMSPPDVLLVDINLPGASGIECVRRLKTTHPGIHFLMLTVFEDSDSIFRSLAAGASGYLVKRNIPDQLVRAIHDVFSGGTPLSPNVARRLVQYFQQPPASPELEALSPRELEVLRCLAQGRLYKEIADQLGITIDTVSKHLQGIYRKLHVRTRTEAVARYLRR